MKYFDLDDGDSMCDKCEDYCLYEEKEPENQSCTCSNCEYDVKGGAKAVAAVTAVAAKNNKA
jgi:hypothetical protein